MTAPGYEILDRQIHETVRVLAAVDTRDGEIAVAYGHLGRSPAWQLDVRAAALNSAGLPSGALLHGFWVATEGEAREWLAFIGRLYILATEDGGVL